MSKRTAQLHCEGHPSPTAFIGKSVFVHERGGQRVRVRIEGLFHAECGSQLIAKGGKYEQ